MTHVDNPFQSPAVLSFCPGFLGLERGLERVIGKLRVMAYVEIEAFIIANLVAGMEACMVGAAPIWTDAKTFDAQPFRGRIHGITGGYPCPGESLAGLREGHLYKGFIWPAIRRAIAAAKPIWCFFENVDDHLTGTFPIVLRSLHNMGYRVEAGVYSAEETGASHERNRLFILAVANAYCDELTRGLRQISQAPIANENTARKQNGQRLRNELSHSLEEMASPSGTGSQELQPRLVHRQGPRISRPITQCRPEDFPLGQGNEQWQWEEPRELKPGMGCTVNGYNFEGDLLRAYGNSVVEQTAELAFRDLIRKHGLTHLI